jgi:flagellar biosynthetic protein FlhB
MADNSAQDKTERATPRRRSKAREQGQVAQSREIPSVIILFSSLSFFFFGATWMITKLASVMQGIYRHAGQFELSTGNVQLLLWDIFQQTISTLAPFMAVVIIAGVVSNVIQTGFLLTAESFTPKLSKLNPMKGIKRLFSLKALNEIAKVLLKVVIVGWVSLKTVMADIDSIPGLMQLDIFSILTFIGKSAFRIGMYTCMVLAVLAAIDYIFQRWQHEKSLKMTKQEVKDENKMTEGDPAIKARIRSIQREMAQRRMMESVPEATVVITNPTRLAIALKFESDYHAPILVAKGAGKLAERIREIAKANGIPIVEQKPLARTLYKAVEIGDFIPAELYRAVAEILAYVYRVKGLVNSAQ